MLNKQAASRSLAKYLKSKRKEYNLTQEQLAEKSGVDYKHIQNLESLVRVNDPRLSTIVKVAHALAVTPEELLRCLK